MPKINVNITKKKNDVKTLLNKVIKNIKNCDNINQAKLIKEIAIDELNSVELSLFEIMNKFQICKNIIINTALVISNGSRYDLHVRVWCIIKQILKEIKYYER